MEHFDVHTVSIDDRGLLDNTKGLEITAAFFIEADLTGNKVMRIGGDAITVGDYQGWTVDGMMFSLTERFLVDDIRERTRAIVSRKQLLSAYYNGVRSMKFELNFRVNGPVADRWASVFITMEEDRNLENIKLYAIIENITEQKLIRQELLQKAQRDGMTGLYNRKTAENMITERLKESGGSSCMMMLVDVDDLKESNDRFGHNVGDEVIKAVADILREHFSSGDILCRMGGDEFAVFASDFPSEEQQKGAVLKLFGKLSSLSTGDEKPVTCSIGVVFGMGGVDTFEELYCRADKAMYHVKRNGKNDFAIYTSDMDAADYRYHGHDDLSAGTKKGLSKDELMHFVYVLTEFYSVVVVLNPIKNRIVYFESEDHHFTGFSETDTAEEFKRAIIHSLYPEDRMGILSVRALGKEQKTVICRQIGDDGIYRRTSITLFPAQSSEGDPLEIITMRTEE